MKNRYLILVQLSDDQILQARKINGKQKKITHAVLCLDYGQLFGTEIQCKKYFDSWKNIFSKLFSKTYETNKYEIIDYQTTFNLVNHLIQESDKTDGMI